MGIYTFCAIMHRRVRRWFRKKDEWRWVIFDAENIQEAIQKADKIAKDGQWGIIFLGVFVGSVKELR